MSSRKPKPHNLTLFHQERHFTYDDKPPSVVSVTPSGRFLKNELPETETSSQKSAIRPKLQKVNSLSLDNGLNLVCEMNKAMIHSNRNSVIKSRYSKASTDMLQYKNLLSNYRAQSGKEGRNSIRGSVMQDKGSGSGPVTGPGEKGSLSTSDFISKGNDEDLTELSQINNAAASVGLIDNMTNCATSVGQIAPADLFSHDGDGRDRDPNQDPADAHNPDLDRLNDTDTHCLASELVSDYDFTFSDESRMKANRQKDLVPFYVDGKILYGKPLTKQEEEDESYKEVTPQEEIQPGYQEEDQVVE